MSGKLIHLAHIVTSKGKQRLLLRMVEPRLFQWFLEEGEQELVQEVSADTIEEAIRLAARQWKGDEFMPLNCGFRYTLPERDEHGINALFHQMGASLATPNGIYFDTELGNNCFVHNIPLASRDLWFGFKKERL